MATGACKKALNDVNDYFPVVQTNSVTVQPDGSVLVEAEVLSAGDTPIGYIGFCCGTMQEPALLDRQLMAESWDGRVFTATYTGFDPDATYYFRAWAANDAGYVYGNILSAGNIIGSNVSPPCSLFANTCSIGGGQPQADFSTVSEPVAGFNTWEITATSFSGPVVSLLFGEMPTTKVYSTVDFNSPGAGQVFVSFYSGFLSGSLNAGSEVYVHRLSPGNFEITVCDAPWNYNGSTLYLNARLHSPL